MTQFYRPIDRYFIGSTRPEASYDPETSTKSHSHMATSTKNVRRESFDCLNPPQGKETLNEPGQRHSSSSNSHLAVREKMMTAPSSFTTPNTQSIANSAVSLDHILECVAYHTTMGTQVASRESTTSPPITEWEWRGFSWTRNSPSGRLEGKDSAVSK